MRLHVRAAIDDISLEAASLLPPSKAGTYRYDTERQLGPHCRRLTAMEFAIAMNGCFGGLHRSTLSVGECQQRAVRFAQRSLAGATGLVVVSRGVELQCLAGPSDRHPPVHQHLAIERQVSD